MSPCVSSHLLARTQEICPDLSRVSRNIHWTFLLKKHNLYIWVSEVNTDFLQFIYVSLDGQNIKVNLELRLTV